MSEFIQFPETRQDIRINTTFTRPWDGYGPESTARERSFRQSRPRDVTWISTSQPHSTSLSPTPPTTDIYNGPPPPQPIPVPTPAFVAQGLSELEDGDAEYMTVDADVDAEYGYGYSEVSRKKGSRKNFVGGFVSSLKKLPKVVSKGRANDRKPIRQDAMEAAETSRTMLTPDATGTPISMLPQYESNPHLETTPGDVQYVEAFDMPVGIPAGLQNFNREVRHEHTLSAVHEDSRDERDREGMQASHEVLPPADAIVSPVLVDPLPTSDYAKMESPIHPPPETSFSAHIARIRKFVHDINDLPWVASRVAVDYVPRESSRSRYNGFRESRPATSWYNQRYDRTLNLLDEPSSPRALRHHYPHRSRGSSATFPYGGGDGSHTPSREGPPSHHGSSDGHGYPMYPHGYAPAYAAQPLFVYPSAFLPPGIQSSSQSIAGMPDVQQARPVYMITSPPFIPSPEIRYSPPHTQYPVQGLSSLHPT